MADLEARVTGSTVPEEVLAAVAPPPLSDEDLSVLGACEATNLDAALLARVRTALAEAAHAHALRVCKESYYRDQARTMQAVFEHLLCSRQELQESVGRLEGEVAELAGVERTSLELAANVREECDLIQNELETLTQVLFEGKKVNALVSHEARSTHEEKQTLQGLEAEMARVQAKLDEQHRRFRTMKAHMSKAPTLVKQRSTPDLQRDSRAQDLGAPTRTTSQQPQQPSGTPPLHGRRSADVRRSLLSTSDRALEEIITNSANKG